MAEMLENISGIKILNSSFFNEFTVEFNIEAQIVNKKLLEENIIGGLAVGNKMIIAITELTSDEDMDKLSSSLKRILS